MKKCLALIFLLLTVTFLVGGCKNAESEEDDFSNIITSSKKEKTESQEDGLQLPPYGSTYDLPSLPLKESNTKDTVKPAVVLTNFEEYPERMRLDDTVVFVGRKCGKSYQDTKKEIFTSETPVIVLNALYGDVSDGDVVVCTENAGVRIRNQSSAVYSVWDIPPLQNDVEYLFILFKTSRLSISGETLYSPETLFQPYIQVESWENLRQKADVLQGLEKRDLELLNYFLDDYDTRISVREEAEKFVQISSGASQEEILALLPAEIRTVFEKLITQYGAR